MPAAMGSAICKIFLTMELSVRSFIYSQPSRFRQRFSVPRKRLNSRPIALQSLRDDPASRNACDICQRQIVRCVRPRDPAAGAEQHVGKYLRECAQDLDPTRLLRRKELQHG